MSQPIEDPPFIKFLLNTSDKCDCHFLVGNQELSMPERIGGVQMMLMAHSDVFRTEFMQRTLSEKKDIAITDLYADTFTNLLRFVYGFDNIASLSFEDADNLFYAADKYMISELKDKLATRLMSLVTYDNICGLMNNLACYNMLNLNFEMTKILQEETDKVLASPQFLDLNPQGFVNILQQDMLSVPEIWIWRAAVRWAKHRANSEDGTKLRQELAGPIQHIRVCTLAYDDFCREVVPTRILTDPEVTLACISLENRKKQEDLTGVCNMIEPRESNRTRPLQMVFDLINRELRFPHQKFTLQTKQYRIQLCSIVLHPEVFVSAHRCTITVIIKQQFNLQYKCTRTVEVKAGWIVSVPLSRDALLEENKLYVVWIKRSCPTCYHKAFLCNADTSYDNEHMKVVIDKYGQIFLQKLLYKIV